MAGQTQIRYGMSALVVAIALLSPRSLPAEELLEEWRVTYDGPGQEQYAGDCAWAMAGDQYGNVYVVGASCGSGSYEDYITIKYDSHGSELWTAIYNGPANVSDSAEAVAVDVHGNVYVTGMSDGLGTSYDFATIKYDADGHQEWVARYDGGTYDPDRAYAIVLDDSGNVYVAGQSGFSPYSDYATIKYSNDGEERWVARYDGPTHGSDWAFSIALDVDGNVCVAGTSQGSGTGDDIVTVKYDPTGREEWVARYNGPMNEDISYGPVRTDAAGAVYTAGQSKREESGKDWIIIKYKPGGDEEWIAWHTGPGIGADYLNDMVVSGSGEVWVTGGATSDSTGKDLATIKYDRLGEEVWVATYDGPVSGNDIGFRLALDCNRHVWVAGVSDGDGTDWDWATIRHDSSGQQLAVARYDGVGSDTDAPHGLVVDDVGSAYVTGRSSVLNNDSDIATLKYSAVTGIPEDHQSSGIALELSPNPFSGSTEIRFVIPAGSSHSTLDVFDVRGRLVKRLIGTCESGRHMVAWDGTDGRGVCLSSGIYFARLSCGQVRCTRKMVLLR